MLLLIGYGENSSTLFSLANYFEYMGGNKLSRRIYEGEEVISAGHIIKIMCGRLNNEEEDAFFPLRFPNLRFLALTLLPLCFLIILLAIS